MEVAIQEYNIDIEGPGHFSVKGEGTESCFVPTFGFDEQGKVKSRKLGEKEGYASLQREWIDKQIKLAVENHKEEHKQDMVKGPNYGKDPFDYKMVENGKKCDKVYVFVFTRSDYPNEIGIATADSPFIVEDSKVLFRESKIA